MGFFYSDKKLVKIQLPQKILLYLLSIIMY
jgi:hypothetical protein